MSGSLPETPGKFIQIAVESRPYGHTLFALDENGVIWERDYDVHSGYVWRRVS